MVGAYIGWLAITRLGTPLPLTIACVVAVCALLGMLIERLGAAAAASMRRASRRCLPRSASGCVLDQIVQLLFSPDPRGVPSQVPDWRIQIGGGTIGALDLLIAGIGLVSALLLYLFLRFTKLGWAVRATALDRDAAQQMGVDVNRVNSTVFAIASALGGVSGLLVGMYYNHIDPDMSFQAGLKGIVAQIIGGMGNVPGAIVGSLLLGLIESYGIAVFGTSYRNLFAFVLLILILVLRPNGLFARGRRLPPEPLTGTFIAPSAPVRLSWPLVLGAAAAAAAAALRAKRYILQTLGISWLYAMLALSLTLVAGTVGQISLGHAALLAIGGYASALLALDLGLPVGLAIPAAGLLTALLGTLLLFPSFRLRGHYVSIATLGDRRDRLAGDPQLGQPDAWDRSASRASRRCRYSALQLISGRRSTGSPWPYCCCWRRSSFGCCRLASRPDAARDSRRRRGGALPTASRSTATRPGLRRRWLRRGRERRHHRAHLFLHQPRDLQRPALDPGADHGHPGRHWATSRARSWARCCWSACRRCSGPPRSTAC